jgi:predicted unusual protein kinase regulating ubiquinone biosynthesis (AarF/ABC1/UbiB family)
MIHLRFFNVFLMQPNPSFFFRLCASRGNILIDLNRGRRKPLSSDHVPTVVPYDNSLASRQLRNFLGVTLVDAGMVAQLTEEESATFIGLLSSLGEGDGKAAAEFALQFSAENNLSEEERHLFSQDMVKLFEEQCRGYETDVDVSLVLRGILGLIRKHRVRIDSNFATLVVNALCVENLARQVCPSYNVLDASKPLLKSYSRMCFGKDGTLKKHPSKSKLVRAWLSLMIARKSANDYIFFKKEASRQKKNELLKRVLPLE